MFFCKRTLLTVSLVLVVIFSSTLSFGSDTDTQRGVHAVASSSEKSRKAGQVDLYDRMTAVIIGIDRYRNLDASRQLSGAVRDAKGVAEVLQKYYAFEQIQTLYNEEANRENIIKVLHGQLTNVNTEDGVLIYFAGHGVTQPTSQKRDLGFLIPYDGSLEKDQMYKNISMQQIKTDITPMIPAKHVLVIADACFGGLLLDTRSASTKAAHNLAYLREITAEPVRQIITAGGKGQMVLDNGPGGHSVFTGRLIEALKEVENFVTAKELGVRLQKTVYGDAMSRGHQQRPQVGELYGTGDFVFVPDTEKRRQKAREKVAELNADLTKLKRLKTEAAERKEEAQVRELERERLQKEAALKQARLREEAARKEAAMKKSLRKELEKDRQEKARKEKERRQRIAALKEKTRKMLQEMGGSTVSALDLEGAQNEVKSIRNSIAGIEKDYQEELDQELWSLQLYYEKQFARASDIEPYDEMFETREDYEDRRDKAEAKISSLIREKAEKLKSAKKRIQAKMGKDVNPLEKQIEEISKKTFPVGPDDIDYEFVEYNPGVESFNVACTINGVYSTGLVHIPKAKARTYYKNPDLLIPEAHLTIAENGTVYPADLKFRGAKGESYEAEVSRTIKNDYLDMELVYVPGGCYEMGCGPWTSDCDDDEKPVHTVCLDGFYMGRYEVTQAQWKKVMRNNPSDFDECGDNCPVEDVSWFDVQKFIKRVNKKPGRTLRLPTEAEWEYAARSGGKREKYAGGSNLDSLAWYETNSGDQTHPVGQKNPNGLGLYDMSGNVWEWCQDIYHGNAYKQHALNNPIYESEGSERVGRGGSWVDFPRGVRAARRVGGPAVNVICGLGFRLCLSRVR